MFKWTKTTNGVVGLENFGNTCYINSVLQSLYHISLFRDNLVIETSQKSITKSLRDLFCKLKNTRKSLIAPYDFVNSLKNEFSNFRNMSHQDAQEMFNFTLNYIIQDLSQSYKNVQKKQEKINSWAQKLFMGTTTTCTTCLTCENVTKRDEEFLDLSLEIYGDLLNCLKEFEKIELLDGKNKFYCEGECGGSYQEAKKRYFTSLNIEYL